MTQVAGSFGWDTLWVGKEGGTRIQPFCCSASCRCSSFFLGWNPLFGLKGYRIPKPTCLDSPNFETHTKVQVSLVFYTRNLSVGGCGLGQIKVFYQTYGPHGSYSWGEFQNRGPPLHPIWRLGDFMTAALVFGIPYLMWGPGSIEQFLCSNGTRKRALASYP